MDKSEPVKIPLVNSDLFAIVDAEDAEFARQFEWFAVCRDGRTCAVTYIPDDEGGQQAVYLDELIARRAGLLD